MRVLDTDEQRIVRSRNLVNISEKLNRTKLKEVDKNSNTSNTILSLAIEIDNDNSTYISHIHQLVTNNDETDSDGEESWVVKMRWNVSDIYKVEWRPKINAFSIAYRGVRDVIIWKLLNYNEDTSSCGFLYFVIEAYYLQHSSAKF